MSFSVFVSYSTLDLAIASQIQDALAEPQVAVFLAHHSVPCGTSLDAAIRDAIGRCDLFVLLWSQHSRESEWIGQEIGTALTHRKAILPLMLDEGSLPPGFIRNLKYLRFTEGQGDRWAQLRADVLQRAHLKLRNSTIAAVSLGAGLLWLLSGDDESVGDAARGR